MSKMVLTAKEQRRRRTRAKIWGTAERPRLNVHVSNKNVTAQLIDDDKGVTLAAVATAQAKEATGTLTAKAAWAGEQIADKAKAQKVKTVIFDRGTKIYHGRLHALAEAARKKGLEL